MNKSRPIALLRSSQLVCVRIHNHHHRRLYGFWPHHQLLGRPKIFCQYERIPTLPWDRRIV